MCLKVLGSREGQRPAVSMKDQADRLMDQCDACGAQLGSKRLERARGILTDICREYPLVIPIRTLARSLIA